METKESIKPSTIAVVAGMVAAVKLSKIDFNDARLMNSPLVHGIIGDSVVIARRIARKAYQDGG